MIAVVKAEPTPKPVYVGNGDASEFYIRVGNTTKPLDLQASHDYIKMHWEA